MRIVFQPPVHSIDNWPGGLDAAALADLAVAAEEAGFDAIAMTDHPFPSDAWLASGGHHSLDPFVALGYVAARTRRIRLITNLVVAAYRNPYLTAKAAATVDVLSGGRLVLGMGAGYLAAEFAVLGAEHDGRGPRFDASIAAIRAAWTGESVQAEGPFPAAGHTALPRPLQRPGPPIWIGGNSRAARRRAARLGDGWMPFQQPPEQAAVTGTDPLTTLEDLALHVAELGRLRTGSGRAEPLDVCFAPRRVGSAAAMVSFLDSSGPACVEAGVTWLSWPCTARSLPECLAAIEEVGKAAPQHGG